MNRLVFPADATRPRVDTVIKRGEERHVLAGTPTVGATLTNRAGCAAPPEGWEVESYVLVAAGAVTISEADVMPNLWTPELDAAVARIEASLRC